MPFAIVVFYLLNSPHLQRVGQTHDARGNF